MAKPDATEYSLYNNINSPNINNINNPNNPNNPNYNTYGTSTYYNSQNYYDQQLPFLRYVCDLSYKYL